MTWMTLQAAAEKGTSLTRFCRLLRASLQSEAEEECGAGVALGAVAALEPPETAAPLCSGFA